MASVEPKTAEQIRRRPRYIETIGETSPLSVTHINRETVEGESVSRDYEFSRTSIDQLIAQGYAIAVKTLERQAKSDERRSQASERWVRDPLIT